MIGRGLANKQYGFVNYAESAAMFSTLTNRKTHKVGQKRVMRKEIGKGFLEESCS